MAIPVNIITGFLGVGKTTAIRHLLSTAPTSERWAVLVNEFGDVPIDQGSLAGQGAVAVTEVAGGCICCSLGEEMGEAVRTILSEVKPDRLLVEPTGLGHPGGVIEALTEAEFKPQLELRTVICLVDPKSLADPLILKRKTFIDQAAVSDVLVAAKADLASGDELAQFNAWAGELFPPKEVVGQVQEGRMDPAWLDLQVENRLESSLLQRAEATGHHHAHGHHQHGQRSHPTHCEPRVDAPCRFENRGLEHQGCGWIFHVEERFHEYKLMEIFEGAIAGLPHVARMKGIFRVGPGRRILIDRVGERLTVNDSIAFWRDSRVELIVAQDGPQPDWLALEEAMKSARWGQKK
uniref:Putative cobalamin synthesis protein CobW n=1 Tax=Magnetococcus massalia (strain MO-1) TaxID=451514 RepID=A0A1S7LJ65_MAGMO|nr:putative cobalamin synthesis protein CobW [Candidatus Magnetococcus massalia]